jgi:three-Cys-motif partner protein
LRHKESDYDWAKRRAKALFSDVDSWNDDIGDVYEKVDVWTVKKLLALDEYIEPFHKIAKKYFSQWVYIDFFSVPGLMRFSSEQYKKKHLCKGSPLIPLFLSNKYPFTSYFFFDKNPSRVSALSRLINRMAKESTISSQLTINSPEALSFEQSSQKLFGQTGSIKKKALSLVVIDPEGYEGVMWESLSSILQNWKVDLIYTFMTYALIRNKNKATSERGSAYARNLDAFFGDSLWREVENDQLLDHFCKKLKLWDTMLEL